MAALRESLRGHRLQRQHLEQLAQAGRLPSSLIFAGPQGIGKATVVRALLQSLNCRTSPACGQCSSCLRSLEDRNERVIFLRPEGKRSIGVEQVREIQAELSLQLEPGVHRFVVLDPADKLTQASANALLKVLEEPPPRTHFFLLTTHASRLLPTLRSRSQLFLFKPLTGEDLAGESSIPPWVHRWAKGRWSRAQRLASEEGEQIFRDSFAILGSMVQGELRDWKKDFPWFFQADEDRQFALETWSEALRQRAFAQAPDLDFLGDSGQVLAQIEEEVQSLQRDLDSNVDKVLAMDAFFYRIQPIATN